VHRGTGLTSPRVTADFLVARLGALPYEVFTMIYLDNHCRFIAAQDLFRTKADEYITDRVKAALALVDIKVLDHCLGGFCSVTTAVKIDQSPGFCGINREQRIQ
jgi:DNA repair protein RadC